MFIAKLDRLSKYLQKNTRMFEFTKKLSCVIVRLFISLEMMWVVTEEKHVKGLIGSWGYFRKNKNKRSTTISKKSTFIIYLFNLCIIIKIPVNFRLRHQHRDVPTTKISLNRLSWLLTDNLENSEKYFFFNQEGDGRSWRRAVTLSGTKNRKNAKGKRRRQRKMKGWEEKRGGWGENGNREGAVGLGWGEELKVGGGRERGGEGVG